jgi:hypothetical protein
MLSSSSFFDDVAAFSFSSSSISSSRLSMMSGGRSPLAQQYKNVQSIRGGVPSGSGYSRPRMAPPGEPEPEVRVEHVDYIHFLRCAYVLHHTTRSINPITTFRLVHIINTMNNTTNDVSRSIHGVKIPTINRHVVPCVCR